MEELPTAVMACIFSWLGIEDHVTLRLVSRRVRNAQRLPQASPFSVHMRQTFDALGAIAAFRPRLLDCVGLWCGAEQVEHLATMTSLTVLHINLDPKLKTLLPLTALSRLTTLTLGCVQSHNQATVMRTLTILGPSLTDLTLFFASSATFDCLPNTLRRLSLRVSMMQPPLAPQIAERLVAEMRQLETFCCDAPLTLEELVRLIAMPSLTTLECQLHSKDARPSLNHICVAPALRHLQITLHCDDVSYPSGTHNVLTQLTRLHTLKLYPSYHILHLSVPSVRTLAFTRDVHAGAWFPSSPHRHTELTTLDLWNRQTSYRRYYWRDYRSLSCLAPTLTALTALTLRTHQHDDMQLPTLPRLVSFTLVTLTSSLSYGPLQTSLPLHRLFPKLEKLSVSELDPLVFASVAHHTTLSRVELALDVTLPASADVDLVVAHLLTAPTLRTLKHSNVLSFAQKTLFTNRNVALVNTRRAIY
jgi:hypothetical protein